MPKIKPLGIPKAEDYYKTVHKSVDCGSEKKKTEEAVSQAVERLSRPPKNHNKYLIRDVPKKNYKGIPPRRMVKIDPLELPPSNPFANAKKDDPVNPDDPVEKVKKFIFNLHGPEKGEVLLRTMDARDFCEIHKHIKTGKTSKRIEPLPLPKEK